MISVKAKPKRAMRNRVPHMIKKLLIRKGLDSKVVDNVSFLVRESPFSN